MTAEHSYSLQECLRKIDFLAGVPDHLLEGLEKKLIRINFDKGSHIIRSGRTGSAFYILASGSVSVWTEGDPGQNIQLATLNAPSHFGEIASLGDCTRTASVIAEEPVVAYLFKKEEFDVLAQSQPQISEALNRIARARRVETAKKIEMRQKTDMSPLDRLSHLEENKPKMSGRGSGNILEAVKTSFLPLFDSSEIRAASKARSASADKGSPPAAEEREAVKRHEQTAEPSQKARPAASGIKKRRGRLSQRSLSLFTLQFSTMYNAGLTYVAALDSLTHTSDENLNRVSEKLAYMLKSGYPLWKAMESIPEAFSPFYTSVIRLNEKIGNLPEGMNNLALYLDNEEKKRSKLISSLTYPFIILLSSIVMVAFLLFYVFPRFMPLFENEGAEIPQMTQILLNFTKCPAMYLLIICSVAVILFFLIRYFYRTPIGKARLQALAINVPILGNLIVSMAVARIARSISVLIRGSGSLFFTLKIIRSTPTGVVKVDKAVDEMSAMIANHGSSLEEALGNFSVFPQAMVSMVAAGVYTGNLPECLNKYAEMVEIQNETMITDLLTIVEPIMLLMLGIVVGFIVLAAFLPVFQLLKTL